MPTPWSLLGRWPALTRRGARLLAATLSLGAFVKAEGQIAVIGNSVDEHTVAPGQGYDGTIVVRNLTDRPQPVLVYQTDYSFLANGTARFDSAGSTPRSNARWITPSASSLTIPAMSDVTLSYAVNVPASDTLRGSFWSAIMVEGAPTAPPAGGARQVGIGAVVRYAVQVATHLPTPGSRHVRLTKQAFTLDTGGTHILDIVVVNTGERAYRPLLWAELYDAGGSVRARLERQRGLLYPGTSIQQRFTFGVLPKGSYKAVVFADTGDDTVSAAQYTLTF